MSWLNSGLRIASYECLGYLWSKPGGPCVNGPLKADYPHTGIGSSEVDRCDFPRLRYPRISCPAWAFQFAGFECLELCNTRRLPCLAYLMLGSVSLGNFLCQGHGIWSDIWPLPTSEKQCFEATLPSLRIFILSSIDSFHYVMLTLDLHDRPLLIPQEQNSLQRANARLSTRGILSYMRAWELILDWHESYPAANAVGSQS